MYQTEIHKLQTIQSCIYFRDLFYSDGSTMAHGNPMVWLTELIFFIAACMELCFELVFKRVWIRPMFWLLQDSAYTVLGLLSPPHSSPIPAKRLKVDKKLGGEKARTNYLSWSKGLLHLMLRLKTQVAERKSLNAGSQDACGT